jgi:hypothetical protein
VRRIDKGKTLEMEDLFGGKRVVVHDKLLSESATTDMCLPLRVIRAGGFQFPVVAGPPLSAMDFPAALVFLREEGLELTPRGLARSPHLLGRLWAWVEERAARGVLPRLQNTDGEDLVIQTASFSVQDAPGLRRALEARPDLEAVEEDDIYLWFREQGPKAKIPGDRLHLGRLQLIGDEAVLEVNSEGRLQKARGWLEAIPGVRFRSVKARRFEEASEGPLDDRLNPPQPLPMTPELAAPLKEFFHKHYLAWLDEPLPHFGGRTPRRMCATERGRREVELLIRSIPSPAGPEGADLEVPREEMLRSLGITRPPA